MLKQILGRFPRKSSKSVTGESSGSNSGDNTSVAGGSTASGRSNTVKRMPSAVFPASAVAGIEPLLSLKDVSHSEKQDLFVRKLNLCCVIFDFNDSNKESEEKDLKRETLIELVDFVASGSARFTEPVIVAICKMSAINLFRVFPPNHRSNSTRGETEDEQPIFDPAWSHLQIVYDLLLRFVTSTSLDVKVAKKYVDHSFILRLLDLFNSDDPRERDCLKTILHRIYGKFMVHRPFIRKAVGNIFYGFIFETEQHSGIAELLEIFGSVISGFALPLKEEHKMFLYRVLIPLHKPKSVGTYLQQLLYCITQFLEKEPKLTSSVIRGLLKYWPVTNSQKEVMFLGELEEVLEATDLVEFQNIMVPLFRQIGQCLNNSHFQVAERALFLWNNDRIVSLIANNRYVILPIIFPALERNSENHWNQSVLNLTLNVRKMFSEMDNELVLCCQRKFKEEDVKLRATTEKRKVTWEHLETVANTRLVTKNTAVLVTPAMTTIAC